MPADTKPMSRRTRSSQQVRTQFFQKLGICLHHKSQNGVAERSAQSLRYMPSFYTPLIYNQDEESLREEQRQSRRSTSPTTVTGTKEKKQVKFHESVSVVPIPMRNAYSDRIRAKLWGDAVELCGDVERNHVEFTAENGDWRCACLEEEMYICGVTGELIHPVHVEMKQYVFGTGGFRQQSSLSYYDERQRYL